MTFYNKESSMLYTIQPSGVVSSGVLKYQLRKYFVHLKTNYNSKNVIAVAKMF